MVLVPPSLEYVPRKKSESPDTTNYADFFGSMAALASFEELALSPKPGLVCLDSAGSHSDMNWVTFAMGASVLAPYWREQVLDGFRVSHYKPLNDVAENLRARGREMEQAMFEATGGVNTHKGLIFALSLLTGAAGVCARRGELRRDKILETAKEIITPFVKEDLENSRNKALRGEKLTHGERIYVTYGIGGIRTEAAKGFPSIKAGLETLINALSSGASLRGAAIAALLKIMEVCEDTNVIYRGGAKFWKEEYRDLVCAAAKKFDPAEASSSGYVRKLGEKLESRGISPGGAADLLACTLFMYRSKISGNIYIQNGEDKK